MNEDGWGSVLRGRARCDLAQLGANFGAAIDGSLCAALEEIAQEHQLEERAPSASARLRRDLEARSRALQRALEATGAAPGLNFDAGASDAVLDLTGIDPRVLAELNGHVAELAKRLDVAAARMDPPRNRPPKSNRKATLLKLAALWHRHHGRAPGRTHNPAEQREEGRFLTFCRVFFEMVDPEALDGLDRGVRAALEQYRAQIPELRRRTRRRKAAT